MWPVFSALQTVEIKLRFLNFFLKVSVWINICFWNTIREYIRSRVLNWLHFYFWRLHMYLNQNVDVANLLRIHWVIVDEVRHIKDMSDPLETAYRFQGNKESPLSQESPLSLTYIHMQIGKYSPDKILSWYYINILQIL